MSKTIKSANVTLKPIEVSKALQQGEKFIKWDEDSGAGLPVTLRVDPKGFYLFWTDQNMEVEMLDIATIRDVRTGVHAKVPKDQKIRNVVLIGSQGSLEEKTVTVCYGADFVNVTFVNFCCTRRDIAQMWTEELFSLAYNLNQLNNPTIKFLEKLHTKIILKADKSGKILVKNIVRQFAQNKEDKKRVEKALSESGLPTGKNDTISQSKFQFEDFFAFYKSLTQRTEVLKIFNSLTDNKPHLSANQLVDFLNDVQRDPRLNEILHPYADIQRARDLIRTYEYNKYHQQRSQLTFDGFLRFLMSEDNPIVAPNKMDLCDDMDQPLAHYFINSSHNTYLTGHQITGKSSVEIYRQSLLAGCRCVELDFWNGRTDEPIIVHGYTFVPEISAREVLEAIAESAFKTSDYPVILSFENHCNPRQQAKIANYCRDIFGDMLLDRPLDSHQLEPGGELPPPSLLKHKIIIKNKKKHHHHHKKEGSVGSEDVEARDPAQPQGNGEIAHGPLARQGSKESSESSESESSSGEEEAETEACGEGAGAGEGAGPGAPGAEPETHAAAEISALVNYVQPVHFSSFENAEKKNRFYEMSSFDEKQATTLLKERPIEFVNYNKHQLSRVYPAGTRFDSSNFMPQVFWNAGCQLVALNYQTLDLAMQLNLGTFEYNRRCGYLLKPEFMRRKDRRLDPFAESTVDGIIAGSLSVTVVSGQLLTDKRCGTYVEADMFGLPADTVRKKFRTRVAPNNGINPVYGDEPFVFKKVVLPELAMLRIAAHEESGRLLGHRVLPVLGLRPGYRHVNLRTELGLPLPASLLLLVVVKDYVPDRLSELAEALANPIKYQSELDKREHQLAVLTDDTDAPPSPNNAPNPTSSPAPNNAPSTALPPHDDGRRLSSMLKSDVADSSPNKAGVCGDSRRSLDADVTLTGPVPTSVPAPLPVEDKFTREEKEKEEKLSWEAGLESTLAALLSSKRVRERRGELARKLDLLRRKRDVRETRPLSKLFRRGLSSKNISGGGGGGGGGGGLGVGTAEDGGVAGERELRLRYHHDIYAMLDKMLSAEQRHQMKELTVTLEAEKKEILNKLANSRKEDVKALAKKTNRDKDEILRIKREIHSQSVERGVAECSRLEQAYARRREQLALTHERLRAMLHKHRDQELLELEQLCGGAPEG
ncbi:1-phosphatidylinositol 4,5-bisphosphate phosphodiesterase classes I and II [Papilio machaon]|uniref:1-phosphatidylinositol 4,5-bisphosphate phosphodiesterase classes I and II n=1 Tax=Papilio machaon TaxID=76193 RepID=UPI001E663E77|nr:1-phosphatidylinositol 4,5-bisphosphate phosphodiesterase classes I and II [Papilio machaon]